tara:strand:- start:1788 stop:2747 length:960 start_codon:yes stop_codon:yes gene_type:complete
MNYYEILNIDSKADKKTIKKSYRALALKYHPDKNHGNECNDKFKEIAEAYQVLSDPILRNNYDNSGLIPENFINPDDIFSSIFKNMDPVLGDFISSTINTITESLLDKNNKSIFQVFNNINKTEFIDKGSDLMKFYINKTAVSEDYTYNLKIDETSLDKDVANDIEVDILFLRKYTHINVEIYNKDNKVNKIVPLNVALFNIAFLKASLSFNIITVYPPGIVWKKNTGDLYLKYNLNINNYKQGFLFNYPISHEININYNIKINEVNIVRLPQEGVLHTKECRLGDFYITFIPNDHSLMESSPDPNYSYIKGLLVSDLL